MIQTPTRPPALRGMARTLAPLLIALVALLTLTACGGGSKTPPPKDDEPKEISGRVVLPAGATAKPETLKAVTGLGSFAVAADGTFTAQVIGDGPTEIDVLDATGALVLSAVAGGAPTTTTLDVGSRSSAEVLLYYTLGGFLLPADAQPKVWELIQKEAAVDDLADALSASFAAGGLPLSDEDAALAEELDLAWQSVFGPRPMGLTGSGLKDLMTAALAPAGLLEPQAGGSSNIVIEPDAGTVQSGVSVIHNPVGSGVAAQNNFRRPAALLAYQVGYRDDGGNDQAISPPVLTGTVDVPSTGSLGVIQALTDIVKGEAPWSPAVSGGLPLTLHDGLRTYYQLVLLGPSLDAVTHPPLYDDTRFMDERARWNEIRGDKTLELFMNDIALPILENFAFGGIGHVDASKLGKLRQQFKAVNDTHLASLGIFLKAGGSYAEAVKFVLTELATNNRYRLDFFEVMVDAMLESEKSKMSFEAVEARLKIRASASGIVAAVQIALSAGDVAAIMTDLNSALPAVGWTATASPTLFALDPEHAYFTKSQPQVKLSVSTRGPVTGNFMYRWTTTGSYGELTDGPKKGTTIDTVYTSVWYTVRAPHTIKDDQKDGVSVAVYEVEPGATSIPAGQAPIARMAAELSGYDREIDARLEVRYGSTPPGFFLEGKTVSCATMFLHVPKEKGATKYSITFDGFGGVGNPDNSNTYLFYNSSYTYVIDLNDSSTTIWPYRGVCDWRHDDDNQFYGSPAGFVARDAGDEYLVSVYSNLGFLEGVPPGALDLPDKVALWYDWASQGTVKVTYSK